MKQHEYIRVSSRRGHFNFCDPSQESVETHIAVMNPDGSKKMCCNITTDYEIYSTDVMDLIPEIDSNFKRYCFSTSRDEEIAFRGYLLEHEDDLYIGNQQQEKIKLEKQKEKIEKRLSEINNFLSGQGWFENGVWVEP
jgi:hypothetical protein